MRLTSVLLLLCVAAAPAVGPVVTAGQEAPKVTVTLVRWPYT